MDHDAHAIDHAIYCELVRITARPPIARDDDPNPFTGPGNPEPLHHRDKKMPVAAPFVARPMRQVSTALSDETLDRLDALRVMTGMPSRSAIMAELFELGLALHENPQNAIEMLIGWMIEVYCSGGSTTEMSSADTA